MTDGWTLAVIAGLSCVTVVARSFFFISSKPWSLPHWAQRGLQYAPIAALAAVVVPEVVIPTGFTPNGDGKNDTWEIPGMADYPGADVVIHDRWGQVVFRSNGYRDPWDGTNNGRALAVGTYYYHIQLNQLEGRSPPYTGFVTIVR